MNKFKDNELSPVKVSDVVDPSAAESDPGNPNFRPSNRVELKSALVKLIDDIGDDESADFYAALQATLKQSKDEDKKMDKKDKKVEETIRRAVRKALLEMGPYRDTGLSYSGPATGSGLRAGFEECEACEGEGVLPGGKDCKVCKGTGSVKSSKRGYQMSDTEAGEASFDEIAKEVGFAGAPGARQAIQRALEKARFAMSMDPADLEIITLTAMNDYIEQLKSSGELTSADVQLMKDHPNIVAGLDGFREFLDGALKKAQKST